VGDYHILMQFDIDASQETLRRALTTQDGIRAWWSARADGPDEGMDGQLRVSFPDVTQPFELEMSRDDAEHVEWKVGAFPPWWAGTTVRWDLSANPDGPGTRLLFSHRDYDPENPVIPIVTPAWAQIILGLKHFAETGEPRPFFAF
jgi:uncharacterized protein YndB with AHSA1/START domain